MTAYLDSFGLTVTDYFKEGDFFVSLAAAGLSDEEEMNLSDRLFGAFALLPEDEVFCRRGYFTAILTRIDHIFIDAPPTKQ